MWVKLFRQKDLNMNSEASEALGKYKNLSNLSLLAVLSRTWFTVRWESKMIKNLIAATVNTMCRRAEQNAEFQPVESEHEDVDEI